MKLVKNSSSLVMPPDPNFASVVSLPHWQNSYTDTPASGTWTPNGTVGFSTAVTDPYGGARYLLYSAGTNGNRATSSASVNAFNGDYTAEFLVYFTSMPTAQVFYVQNAASTGGIFFGYNPTGGGYGTDNTLFVGTYGSGVQQSSSTVSLTTGTWYYIAFKRVGTTLSFQVNSTGYGTATSSNTYTAGAPCIMGQPNGSYCVFGYFADMRITSTGRTLAVPTYPYPDY